MKVVFLDFDGVLNGEWHGNPEHIVGYKHEDRVDNYYKNKHIAQRFVEDLLNEDNDIKSYKISSALDLDCDKVMLLNSLVEKTDCKIVFSTSWRGAGVKRLTLYLVLNHFLFPHSCIDVTPFMEDRGEEIQHWLNAHPEVTKYAIIDDDRFDIEEYHPKENFFNVSGLTANDVYDIIKFLNK